MFKDLGIEKIDSWQLVGQIAVELSGSRDITESIHGDIWIDQCMGKYTINKEELCF
jgi:hypothetical protein